MSSKLKQICGNRKSLGGRKVTRASWSTNAAELHLSTGTGIPVLIPLKNIRQRSATQTLSDHFQPFSTKLARYRFMSCKLYCRWSLLRLEAALEKIIAVPRCLRFPSIHLVAEPRGPRGRHGWWHRATPGRTPLLFDHGNARCFWTAEWALNNAFNRHYKL